MADNNNKIPGYVEYLNPKHRYYIVIALNKDLENNIYDCRFFDDYGNIKDGYQGFWFDERMFLLMEKYLYNFIDAECGLLINMYEEEYAEPEILPQILEITDRTINNCDNEEVLKLAKEFRSLVEKAIDLKAVVGFCF